MSNKKATFSVRPFDKLRKTMEQREAAAAPPPPRQKKKEDYTDEELFSREMNDVLVIGIPFPCLRSPSTDEHSCSGAPRP